MDSDSRKQQADVARVGKLFRHITKFLVCLILVSFVLLLGKCTVIHFEHDAAAHRLLIKLQHLPLPQNAHLFYENAEVGTFWAATGDATEIGAYRVFSSDLPMQNISDFFAPLFKQSSGKIDAEFGVCQLDARYPLAPSLPLDSILRHVPQSERNRTYVLYATRWCTEEGFWDARGW